MDTSPNVPNQPQDPQHPQGSRSPQAPQEHQPLSDAPKSRRSRTPLIAGAAVLAVALLGGALYWALPGLISEPEPESVAVAEPPAPYAGDYLLGEPTWNLQTSRLSREISEVWTEQIDDVEFSEQVANNDLDPGIEFLALEEQVKAPKNGSDYRNDVVLAQNAWYPQLRDGSLDLGDGDPVHSPEDIKVLGNVVPRTMQYVVRADSDIHTLDDLVGTTLVFTMHSMELVDFSDLTLLSAGLDPFAMDVITEQMDARNFFLDGNADVFVYWDRVRNQEIEHFERQGTEVRVLEIPEEVVETVSEVDPSSTNFTVEAGTLPNQDEDINLMASWETLYAHVDLDEDLVYELVRAVYEDLDDHALREEIATAEWALSGVDPEDVHPGAARYFQEQGTL